MSTPLPRPVRNRDIMLRTLDGQSPEMIAEVYGLEPQTIVNIVRSPLVQDELARLQGELGKDIVQKVKARSHEALETVTDTMRGEVNSELRFKAAKDLLDRNPDLQPKQQDLAGAIGAGMGEYIVRELARRRAQANEPATGNPSESEREALGKGERAGNDHRDSPREALPLLGDI